MWCQAKKERELWTAVSDLLALISRAYCTPLSTGHHELYRHGYFECLTFPVQRVCHKIIFVVHSLASVEEVQSSSAGSGYHDEFRHLSTFSDSLSKQ